MKKLFLVILIGLFVSCVKVNNAPLDEEDGELVALLNELDKCQNTGDHECSTNWTNARIPGIMSSASNCIRRSLLNMKRRT